MTTFTFNTKETYLAYRAEWKAEYAQLSNTLRETKLAIKKQHQEKGWADYQLWVLLRKSVARANVMLDDLKEAKVDAGRQYNLQKEELTC